MCQCRTTAAGTIVCDECASQMIEALSDLNGQQAAELPPVLTASEYQGLASLVRLWLCDQQDQEVQA